MLTSNARRRVGAGVGMLLVALGALAAVGWLLQKPLLVQWRLSGAAIVLSSGLCFVALGAALLLPWLLPQRAATPRTALGWLLLAVSLLVLGSHLADVNLGLDFPSLHQWLDGVNPRPGRMAPTTALGFAGCGLVLVLLHQVRSLAAARTVLLAVFAVLGLALTGLASHSLRLEWLYPLRIARMALPCAFGLLLAGVCLWLECSHAAWYRTRRFVAEDEKVTLLGVAVLAIATMTAGLAGFAVQAASLEKSLGDDLYAVLDSRTVLFQTYVRGAQAEAQNLAARPALTALDEHAPRDPERYLRPPGVRSFAVLGLDGRERLRIGPAVTAPIRQVALPLDMPVTLAWDRELYLKIRLPLLDNGRRTGTLVTEHRLAPLAAQFSTADGLGESGRLLLCTRDARGVPCFPALRQPLPHRLAAEDEGGQAAIADALNGRRAIHHGKSADGRNVVLAYGPLGAGSLALAVQEDAEELYRPIRDQLEWSLLLLLLFTVLTGVLLRLQLRPLTVRLLQSEQDARDKELRLRNAHADLEQQVLRRTAQLRALGAHQDRIKEAERSRIAREIHDELGGLLTGVRSYLSYAALQGERSEHGVDRHLDDACQLADEAMDTVRRVINDLRPSVLDQLGLWAALDWHVGQVAQRSGLQYVGDYHPDCANCHPDAARSIAVFRIVQEAVTNVVKHAKASTVHITVLREERWVVIEVRDDGRGITPSSVPGRQSWGITGMRERASYFDGELTIGSTLGGGTCVTLRMPAERKHE